MVQNLKNEINKKKTLLLNQIDSSNKYYYI